MGETTRQRRVQNQIQQDLAEIFQSEAREAFKGKIISITRVKITSDLMDARVYISAFPMDDKEGFMEYVEAESPRIKNVLAQRIKHQMRRIPNIQYVFDDSLDYVDDIDNALKGKGEDPIRDSKLI